MRFVRRFLSAPDCGFHPLLRFSLSQFVVGTHAIIGSPTQYGGKSVLYCINRGKLACTFGFWWFLPIQS